MNILKILLLTFSVLALLFVCISVGGHGWLTIDVNGKDFLYGLWKSCAPDSDCEEHKTVEDWMKSCRAMMLLGLVAILAGVVLSVVNMLKSHKITSVVICVVFGLSAIFLIAGLSLFVDEMSDSMDTSNAAYGWAFVLGWIALVFSVVCLVLSIVDAITGAKK